MPSFQDLAYELDDVVSFREIYEREGRLVNMFYHINLTTKTKGDDGFQSGVDNVFFAEVTRIKGEDVQYVLSCFFMVEPNDNGIFFHFRLCSVHTVWLPLVSYFPSSHPLFSSFPTVYKYLS